MKKNPPDVKFPGIRVQGLERMLGKWDLPGRNEISWVLCATQGNADPAAREKEILNLYLNQQEKETYKELEGKKTQGPWLAGRIAAKDSIRRLMERVTGSGVAPIVITIRNDEHGKPWASGRWSEELPCHLILSISHIEEFAVAVAGLKSNLSGLGVDVSLIREMGEPFIREAFHQTEIDMLKIVGHEHRSEWVFRFWCSKEAAGKAVGRGLWHGPKSLRITDVDWKRGAVELVTEGRLREVVGRCSLKAFTEREGDFMFCLSFFEAE